MPRINEDKLLVILLVLATAGLFAAFALADVSIVSESGSTPYVVTDDTGAIISRHQREDKAIEAAIKLGGTHWVVKDGKLRVQVTGDATDPVEPPPVYPTDPPVIEPPPVTAPPTTEVPIDILSKAVSVDDFGGDVDAAYRAATVCLTFTRGKTYKLQREGDFKQFKKSGMWVVAVGDGAAPRIDTNGYGFISCYASTRDVHILGLDIYSSNPTRFAGWAERGIHIASSCKDWLIEGCSVRGYFINVWIEGGRATNITVRSSYIADAHRPSHIDSGWPLGVYSDKPINLTLDGNRFDSNGWDRANPGSRNGFSQQVYVYGPDGLTVTNNTFVNGGFLDCKVRADKGTEASNNVKIAGNVFTGSMLAIGVGGDNGTGDPSAILHRNTIITDNLIINTGGKLPNDNAEHGNGINVDQVDNCVIGSNILVDRVGTWTRPSISLEHPGNKHGAVTAQNNVVHDWPGGSIASITGTNNDINLPASTYKAALGVDALDLSEGAAANINNFKQGYQRAGQ